MGHRSLSREFFVGIASMLLIGLMLMGGIQVVLSSVYFANERRTALTAILDGASILSTRFAAQGNNLTLPEHDSDDERRARDSFDLFRTTAGAVVFVADSEGNIRFHNGESELTGAPVGAEELAVMAGGRDLFVQGDLGGVLNGRFYVAGRALDFNNSGGYVFAATSMDALRLYMSDMLNMYILSAALMLIVSGALSVLFARRVTAPINAISAAALRLGGGDFSARAPVDGYEELAAFATTFNDMAARLQTIDNSRGQFMGNIAHELRTPMTSIQGFIDGMLDGTIPPEENPHYLAIVSQETARLSRLVQNMLDITKLEAGEVPIRARSYDVWQTVTDVVLADEQRIEDGRIDIQGLDGGPMRVYADPDLVHQVVYNLVDNAIKFTPPGGTIRFAARQEGATVELCVENTGAGIAAEALPYVFERFYKEDRSRGLNTRGAGLGLHICKILVTLLGGQIRVESEEGAWCRFLFTLPANAPAAADAPAGKSARRPRRKRR